MARRSFLRRRAAPRRASAAVRKTRRSGKRSGAGVKLFQLDAVIYGAARGYTSNLLAPITAKIPLGSIADEVVMLGANYLIAKNMSGMIKDIAMKGLIIENARLGEAVVTGGIGSLTQTSTQKSAYDY